MRLIYRIPTIGEALESTIWTQEDRVTPYWRDGLYKAYPLLDKKKILSLPWRDRENFLKQELSSVYYKILPELKRKSKRWNSLFKSQKNILTSVFSSVFEVNAENIFNDMFACPNLNPVNPRYLSNHSFFLFYRLADDVMMRTSLHEIMHFFWFYKWQQYFHDSSKDYDTPHLKWIYSEMVTDTFARYSELKKIYGNYPAAYDYFYTLKLGEKCVLDILGKIYKTKGLEGLFRDGFDFVKVNEKCIRSHIRRF